MNHEHIYGLMGQAQDLRGGPCRGVGCYLYWFDQHINETSWSKTVVLTEDVRWRMSDEQGQRPG